MNQTILNWPFGSEHYIYNGLVFIVCASIAVVIVSHIFRKIF